MHHHRKFTKRDIDLHLKNEHKINPFSTYLREIVYGGNDGIVTTFAVVAGFAGAQAQADMIGVSVLAVLLFGFANLFADATSMGLGNFLSIRSEQKVYRNHKQKEEHEIRHNTEYEINETMYLLKKHGFSEEQAHAITKLYAENPKYWAEFMMRYELDMQNPEGENPALTGLATFLSFIIFGIIPLIPYILFRESANTFHLAVLFTASALVLLGILRWKVTKEKLLACISEVLLIGGIASIIAYFVGSLF